MGHHSGIDSAARKPESIHARTKRIGSETTIQRPMCASHATTAGVHERAAAGSPTTRSSRPRKSPMKVSARVPTTSETDRAWMALSSARRASSLVTRAMATVAPTAVAPETRARSWREAAGERPSTLLAVRASTRTYVAVSTSGSARNDTEKSSVESPMRPPSAIAVSWKGRVRTASSPSVASESSSASEGASPEASATRVSTPSSTLAASVIPYATSGARHASRRPAGMPGVGRGAGVEEGWWRGEAPRSGSVTRGSVGSRGRSARDNRGTVSRIA